MIIEFKDDKVPPQLEVTTKELDPDRLLWTQAFDAASGIEPSPPDIENFAEWADGRMRQFKKCIEADQANYLSLQKALDGILADAKQTSSFELTAGQKQAMLELTAWLKSSEPYYVLRGFAGTGKTHLVSLLAAMMPTATSLFTAPTNKATKVLRRLLPKHTCKTIYSALSLRMVEREDELVLQPALDRFNLAGFKVIGIDESSMLNTELMIHVRDTHQRYGLKFLFICDLAQLPPVGEDISPVAELKAPTIELTEVVRHDNQILELATHIRRCIVKHTRLTPWKSKSGVEKCVWQLSSDQFISKLQRAARSGFNDMRAIAWRNSTVDRLNELVRAEIYSTGDIKSSMWLPGDFIVLTEAVGKGKRLLATTDDEGIVVDSTIGKDPDTGLKCYFVNVRMETGITLRLRVIHEDSEDRLSAQLAKLARNARMPGKGKLWQEFWGLKNRFNGIRHSYAITAHRSQGSTFKFAFVDAGDILANSDTDTAYRCLYVATTRPSHRLYTTGLPQ